MVALKNDRLIRALLRRPVDCTPVWMMRQAGRYLPEYRQTRARAGDFMSLCKNPQLACEVTLQPLERFDLDAAILFSDILTIPDAMELGLYFEEGEGPKFRKPIRTAKDIETLPAPDVADELGYVMDAVSLIRQELNGKVPLIGFSGSPWTLATYMVEGGPSRDFATIKTMLYNQPEILHQLLGKLSRVIIDYLNAQIRNGVQVVQIFDTWGGVLTGPAYREFSLQYARSIISELDTGKGDEIVPVIWFTKGGGLWLEDMLTSGCDCLGLDWTVDIGLARERVAGKISLQGNMDPAVLRASSTIIEAEVKKIIDAYGAGSGHVFNLGHGITPDVPPTSAKIMVDAVHNYSSKYHAS